VYLLEGFYFLPTRKSVKFHEIFRKLKTKWVNNPVGKKANTPKVNTRVNTFLLLALGFYLNPTLASGFYYQCFWPASRPVGRSVR